MITVNASASKRNNFMILETYFTQKVEANKLGKFKGGSISSSDIFGKMPVDNCNIYMVCTLFQKHCFRLSNNSFYVTISDFKVIYNELKEFKMIYLDNTDKTLVLIDTIIHQKPNKKSKYSYSIGLTEISWFSDSSLYLSSDNSSSNICKIEPVPHLQYIKEEQIYALYFDYAGSTVSIMDKKPSIIVNDKIILRNYDYEDKTVKLLVDKGFTKLSGARFLYSGRRNLKTLKHDLFGEKVIIDDDENTIYPEIHVSRSDSGWFEIDLSYTNDGKIFDLASKMQLFASENEIAVDDKIIELPDSLIQAREYLSIVGNKLRINQDHIFELLHIIYESNSEISKFFEYKNVELDIPKKIKEQSFPYQLEGIKWLKFLCLNHLGGCLADDMGLGKTFQIISFLEDTEIKDTIDKILIVVPKSLLTNWQKEFQKFESSYRVGIFHGYKREELLFEDVDIIITTYNTAYLDLKKLNERKYSIVIFDEIQTIKNYKSITSDAMKQINSEIRIGLSGTPMENNISELWNIMDVLNPNAFHSHDSFLRRYNGRNYDELKNILNLFIMRRMKKDVLKELPPKNEQIIYCDMGQKQRELYTGINIAVKKAIMSLKAFAAPVVLKGLTLLRECCCHPLMLNEETNVDRIDESCKLDALSLLIDNLSLSGHKVLIFSNYTSMLKIIKEVLEKKENIKNSIFFLDGKTKNRAELVNEFEKSETGIFLISIKAGGVGLNLVSAQDVIIYDPWWNPFVEQQAIDRAYRIGQDKSVTVYKLVAANTIEERIVDMQKIKKQDFDELINGISTDKNILLKDIIDLL